MGTPLTTGNVASVTQPTSDAGGGRNVVATHMAPSQARKAGSLCVALGGPDEPAPAARAKKAGPRWCVLHDGKLAPVLPQP